MSVTMIFLILVLPIFVNAGCNEPWPRCDAVNNTNSKDANYTNYITVHCQDLSPNATRMKDLLSTAYLTHKDSFRVRQANEQVNAHELASQITKISIRTCRDYQITNDDLHGFAQVSALEFSNSNANIKTLIDANALDSLTSLTTLKFQLMELPDNLEQILRPVRLRVVEFGFLSVKNLQTQPNVLSEFTNLTIAYFHRAGLQQFPGFLKFGSTLKKLIMTENNITELKAEHLQHFVNLEELILTDNRFTRIEPNAFANLKKLKVLELNGDRIQNLTVDMFKSNTELEVLKLRIKNTNARNTLSREKFQFLTKLREYKQPFTDEGNY